jgi:hypothetical protein
VRSKRPLLRSTVFIGIRFNFYVAFVYDMLRQANGQNRGPGRTLRWLMENACKDSAIIIRCRQRVRWSAGVIWGNSNVH